MEYKDRIKVKIAANNSEIANNINPDVTREKFKHKKSLGQNFLKTESILDLIVEAGDIQAGDLVLEIGPGEGALTTKILNKINIINKKEWGGKKTEESAVGNGEGEEGTDKAKLVCIEKDNRLIPILNERFSREIEEGDLTLLEEDILKWNIDEYVKEGSGKNLSIAKPKYKLIANIPYYITGAIMEQFLSAQNKPEIIVVMVQREVAERVVAKDGKQSILALCTKYYGDSEIVKIVKPGNFNPPPKIDSAVLKIKLRPSVLEISDLNKIEAENRIEQSKMLEKTYLQIVKKGLAHKRKKLSSNLKDFDANYNWSELFVKLDIDINARGEDLNYEKFLELAKEYIKNIKG